MNIGKDDGFGNKVKGVNKEDVKGIGTIEKGDYIIIKNSGYCVIATYKIR